MRPVETVYILGAGFSALAGLPVMANFFEKADEILAKYCGGDLFNADDPTFAQFKWAHSVVSEYRLAESHHDGQIAQPLDNLEEVFGFLAYCRALDKDLLFSLFLASDRSCSAPVDALRGLKYLIVKVLEVLTKRHLENRQRLRWYDEFRWNLLDNDAAVVTFNYDLIVEATVGIGDGVRFQCDYGLAGNSVEDLRLRKAEDRTLLCLKLHGSVNWRICSKCKSLAILACYGDDVSAPEHAADVDAHWDMPCRRCRGAAGRYEPLMVSPSWDKTSGGTAINTVWNNALEVLAQARRVVIIGYSMLDTDDRARYLLRTAIGANPRLGEVFVVNPARCAEEKFRKLFTEAFWKAHVQYVPLPWNDAVDDWSFARKIFPVYSRGLHSA